MNDESFVGEVCWRSGISSRARAERAIEATVELIAERLPARDAEALAGRLPARLAALLRKVTAHGDFGVAELFEHVKNREPVGLGAAVEHAQVVCQVLAEALDDEGRQFLHARLPADWAALFVRRETTSLDRPPGPAGYGNTLATGRPGSRRPLSEAAPPAAQPESLVLADNPHGDDKVSSAPGPRAGRPIASEKSGSERPLSEAKQRPR
jgi:uncharacterized protein (DUF2267 family)